MKKKIIFLITILTILLGIKKAYAEEYKFYEAEFIDQIYMNKYQYSNNTIYYQQARKFRNSRTNELVYCIEPLTFFNENSTYTTTTTPRNLAQSQVDRIKKIAYFGYKYKGHIEDSWYAVAQLMIWKEANPYGGDYYFTETLNGQRTNKFDYQISEINRLINEYDHEISIENQTITLVQGETKSILIGNTLNHYTTNNEEISIENGSIIIHNLEEGEYTITLTREKETIFGSPFVIYRAPDSQTLMLLGDLDPKEVHFKIKVISNSITIHKIDEDTQESIPQGDAKLDGAIFQLYDANNQEINQIEITDGEGTIKDIPFGSYYLKEIQPGEGYYLNDGIWEVILSETNQNIDITVSNKIIEKEIIIEKKYGEENNLQPEENITFQILNQNNEVIETVQTNKEGMTNFKIPYGTYTIKQINTTEGYELLNPFQLIVHNNTKETIELNDFKIPVPNTSTNDKKNILIIIIGFILLLC